MTRGAYNLRKMYSYWSSHSQRQRYDTSNFELMAINLCHIDFIEYERINAPYFCLVLYQLILPISFKHCFTGLGWSMDYRSPSDVTPENISAYLTWIQLNWTCNQRNHPHGKVPGANMGPIWGQQDPGGPHVGPRNFAIWGNPLRIWSNMAHPENYSRGAPDFSLKSIILNRYLEF